MGVLSPPEATLSKAANDPVDLACDNSFMGGTNVTEVSQTRRGGKDWTVMFNPTAGNIADVCEIGPLQRSALIQASLHSLSCLRLSAGLLV